MSLNVFCIVYILHLYAYLYVCLDFVYIRLLGYKCLCLYVCLCLPILLCTWLHVCLFVYMSLWLSVCLFICMPLCWCMYACMFLCTVVDGRADGRTDERSDKCSLVVLTSRFFFKSLWLFSSNGCNCANQLVPRIKCVISSKSMLLPQRQQNSSTGLVNRYGCP